MVSRSDDRKDFVRSAVLVLGLSVLSVATLPASASTEPRLEMCNSCLSSFSFKSSAEQSSLQYSPAMEGVDYVYVLNANTEEVRYFDVYRWYEPGDIEPRSMPEGKSQVWRASQGYYHADAVAAPGDPAMESALQEGLDAAKNFAQELAGSVGINEVGAGSNINSAIDLIGPSGSEASLNRNALVNLLNDYYNAQWAQQKFALTDLGQRFVDKILAQSRLLSGIAITIEFEDGTLIQVRFESLMDGYNGGPMRMDLHVMQETARGPGLPAVPLAPGEFNNFSFTGSSFTVQELINLALRYGIPVTGSSGGSDEGSMKCEIDGSHLKCEVTNGAY